MTPLPLDKLELGYNSHRSALWWLGLLYRRPNEFRKALEQQRRNVVRTAVFLWFHVLPWLFLATLAGRCMLIVGLGQSSRIDGREFSGLVLQDAFDVAIGIAVGTAVGIASGVPGGIAVGTASGTVVGIAFGIAGGIVLGIAGGIVLGIAGEIAGGIVVGVAVGIAVGIAGRSADSLGLAGGIGFGSVVGIAFGIAVGIASGIAFGIGIGIARGVASGIAIGIAIPRSFYLAVQPLFIWPRIRAQWYPWHPIAWDNLCGVSFPGLDRLLAAYAEYDLTAGNVEIERLIDTYPAQRTAALKARTRLIARAAGREQALSRLSTVVDLLPAGERGFLAETRIVREAVAEINRAHQQLLDESQPLFQLQLAQRVVDLIGRFHDQAAGLHEPLASEFRLAADQWRKHADQQLYEVQELAALTPIPQAFRAGDPVNPGPEAFLKREDVLADLKREVIFNRNCPGLLLYGRRRVGKSTLIRNVGEYLPDDVQLTSISMQDPTASTSLASLLGILANRVAQIYPKVSIEPESVVDLTTFFATLSHVQEYLEASNLRLILAIDEYETLDDKLGEQVFPLELLAMFRESIQTHRRITWLFAGSHSIDELTHAAWPSYFVSLRTVEVPLFTREETRTLLTDPLQHSPLWRGADRPKFPEPFWGPGGLDRIHAETAGWPHLVQLLAELCVDSANDHSVREISPTLFEAVLAKAIVRGDNVLRLLMHTECRLPGEWDYLNNFRRSDSPPPPTDEAVARSLKRRFLVTEEGNEWRLKVPLMQRWLRERA